MTRIDLTRPRPPGEPGGPGDECPPAGGEADECPDCAVAGGLCEFHRGGAEGWDAGAAVAAGAKDAP